MSAKINDGLTRTQRYYKNHPERKKAQAKAWRQAHPEAVKKWVRRRRRKALGVDDAMVQQMLVDQDYRCGICKATIDEGAHVDHDHSTGSVRGILCRPCNLALGGFGDSVKRLSAAISYLNRWETQCVRSA